MPALSPLVPGRRWRLAVALAALASLALAGGRLAGAGAVTAAEDPAADLTLQADPARSVRASLRAGGLEVADANAAAFALSDMMDTEHPAPGLDFQLRAERPEAGGGLRLIALAVRQKGQLTARLTRAADGSLRLTRLADSAPAPDAPGPGHEATAVLEGPMEDVLYGDPANVSDAGIILEAARLFARKLDLTRDLALGDPVRLVFTREVGEDGRVIGAGHLLYAEIDTHDGPTRLYRLRAGRGGEGGFVDEQGVELDHALLRTPLDRPRITSDFGLRLHPLLGYTRMHQGVDFGAPVGSAVVAAGDGVVEELRWAGGYGRWIKLCHGAGLETGYGHLSAWAPGLKAGSPVRQGQLIGYVGSSGLSTGPHLHYEVYEAGRPVDPKTVQPTGGAMLAGAERVAFENEKQTIAQLLPRNNKTQASAMPTSKLSGGS